MYKYWSKVRVTSWFYEGMEGTLMKKEVELFDLPFSNENWAVVMYTVLYKTLYWTWLIIIPESSLELIQ